MAENKLESAGVIGGDTSSANAQVWTIASDIAPNSDERILLSNSQQELQNYTAVPIPSAPDIRDLPPNHFDISTVPNNAVLHYNEVPPYTEPSKAVVKRETEGVVSYDASIDDNPDQLWLYLMTYLNEKPLLSVKIHGYRVERYTTHETRRSPNGTTSTQRVERTRIVTDFNFSLDLAPYVSEQWWCVAVIPSKKTIKAGEHVTLRDAIEQYTRSKRNIKQIVCQKQLAGWNFHELADKIKSIIYSTGYRCNVQVTFPVVNNRITARSSSKLSRFSKSTLVRVLCVISCLFLIFCPIYLCLRAAGSTKDQIVADYAMAAPIDTFLHFNEGVIANAAIGRSREVYPAYLG